MRFNADELASIEATGLRGAAAENERAGVPREFRNRYPFKPPGPFLFHIQRALAEIGAPGPGYYRDIERMQAWRREQERERAAQPTNEQLRTQASIESHRALMQLEQVLRRQGRP